MYKNVFFFSFFIMYGLPLNEAPSCLNCPAHQVRYDCLHQACSSLSTRMSVLLYEQVDVLKTIQGLMSVIKNNLPQKVSTYCSRRP